MPARAPAILFSIVMSCAFESGGGPSRTRVRRTTGFSEPNCSGSRPLGHLSYARVSLCECRFKATGACVRLSGSGFRRGVAGAEMKTGPRAVSARGPVRRSYGCRNNVRGPSRRRRSLVCRRSTTASLSYEISRRHGIGSVNSTHFGGSRTGSAAIGNKGAESACGSSGGPVLGGAGEREPHGADEAAAAEVGPAAVGERAAVGLEE